MGRHYGCAQTRPTEPQLESPMTQPHKIAICSKAQEENRLVVGEHEKLTTVHKQILFRHTKCM